MIEKKKTKNKTKQIALTKANMQIADAEFSNWKLLPICKCRDKKRLQSWSSANWKHGGPMQRDLEPWRKCSRFQGQ